MNEELLEIGADLEETFKELGWNISHDKLAEISHKQWISRNIEKQKSVKRFNPNPPMAYHKDMPRYEEPRPTDKQLEFLKKLDIPITPNLTKKQASELIQKKIGDINGTKS